MPSLPSLVLASQSPRRKELLSLLGLPFTVRVSAAEEVPLPGEVPEEYVRRLARAKAHAVQPASNEIVLGADTIVLVDGTLLEKPKDAVDAARMLRLLSGRAHQVTTGICLLAEPLADVAAETTTVHFRPLTDAEISAYVATGHPMDKAGAYGIQGYASRFIPRVEGDYFNVVGLPVSLVYDRLRRLWPVPF